MLQNCIAAVLIEAKGPSAETINTKLTIVTNFINTASSIHSEESIVLKRLAHLGKLSGALGIIASIFTITVESIGSRRHKQVMAEFEKVNDGIRQVQEDINLLGKQVVLEHRQTRLFDRFNILRQGLKHLANNDTKAEVFYGANYWSPIITSKITATCSTLINFLSFAQLSLISKKMSALTLSLPFSKIECAPDHRSFLKSALFFQSFF